MSFTPQPAASDVAPAHETPVIHDARQRRLVLVGVSLALMAVVASASGLAVAQQQVAVELDSSLSAVLWMINAYTVVFAALLLPLGAAGDRWGRKPVLLTGVAIFAAASVLTAVSVSAEMLIATRVLSGVGAAMVMPVTLAVITSSFPAENRSQAIGVWSAVAGAGGVLGMFLSALLADVATWRWLFAFPAVLAVAAAVLAVAAAIIALRSVPNSRELASHRYDAVGALTSVVAVIGIVYAIHEGPERGWSAPHTLSAAVLGVAATVCFVLWERRHSHPLLDVRFLTLRDVASGSITLLAGFAVMGGIAVVLFPYFQAVLGWSALMSTVGQLPLAGGMMVASGLAPRLAARIGKRATMTTGILLAGLGLTALAVLASADGGYLSVLPGLIAMGLGFGLTMPPATEAITGALPRERQGVASALNDVTRELGTAVGVALLGSVVAARYRTSITPRLDGMPQPVADAAPEGIANALGVADQAGPDAGSVIDAAHEAFIAGWQQATWVGVAVIAALLVYVALRGPRAAPSTLASGTEDGSASTVGDGRTTGSDVVTSRHGD